MNSLLQVPMPSVSVCISPLDKGLQSIYWTAHREGMEYLTETLNRALTGIRLLVPKDLS